jgi:sporulation protein YqfC
MFEKITEKTRDLFYMNPYIHIKGDNELLIESCRRIEEYNEVFMRLILGKLCIQIWGSNLKAYNFKTDALLIRGKISRIDFIERNGRHDA